MKHYAVTLVVALPGPLAVEGGTSQATGFTTVFGVCADDFLEAVQLVLRGSDREKAGSSSRAIDSDLVEDAEIKQIAFDNWAADIRARIRTPEEKGVYYQSGRAYFSHGISEYQRPWARITGQVRYLQGDQIRLICPSCQEQPDKLRVESSTTCSTAGSGGCGCSTSPATTRRSSGYWPRRWNRGR